MTIESKVVAIAADYRAGWTSVQSIAGSGRSAAVKRHGSFLSRQRQALVIPDLDGV